MLVGEPLEGSNARMVFDSLSFSSRYAALHPRFPAAFAFLQQFDQSTSPGTYELEGRRLFAIVESNLTVPEQERKWEAHRLYADIQFVVSGRERMLYTPVENLRSEIPYNSLKDVEKFAQWTLHAPIPLDVRPGSFCVFFPQDGHKPTCLIDAPERVLKVVVKVLLD